jgi:hypothetical protein
MFTMPASNDFLSSFVIAYKYLCLPASIESLLRHKGYKQLSQIEIANYLGVTFPNDYQQDKIHNHTYSGSPDLCGVRPDPLNISKMLQDYSVELSCRFHNYSEYEDWSFEYSVQQANSAGDGIILCFNYRLFSLDRTDSFGHTALLLGYEGDGFRGQLSVFDPGPEDYGVKKVIAEDMFLSMRSINGGWLHFFPACTS